MAKGFTDFECPICGKTACRGVEAVILGKSPAVSRLSLDCSEGHPDWMVDEKCPECGKVPKYREHSKGVEELPVLECCGAKWHPIADGEINSFLVEENPFLEEVDI